MMLTEKARTDGALIIRHGRKPWRCDGDGAAHPQVAAGCVGTIKPGAEHLECLWSAAAFQSGTRHCIACALAFYPGWVTTEECECHSVGTYLASCPLVGHREMAA